MFSSHQLPQSVVSIYGARGTLIGTGVVVHAGIVLTALHVVDPEPAGRLRVDRRVGVSTVASLPLRRFGRVRKLAAISYHRDLILTGDDLGTVDLALLSAPGLDRPALPLRHSTVENGEVVTVPGYPEGWPDIAVGPVASHDDANFIVGVTLRTGNSGSPAIDNDGCVAGLATLDHDTAGTVFVGPQLLATFLRRAMPLLTPTYPARLFGWRGEHIE